MDKIKNSFTTGEAVITGVAAGAALLAAGRIFLLLYRAGSLYTMGLFPLAVLLGLYCLWKKALFNKEVFFAFWVRLALAAVFTAFQVTGLWWSHAQLEESVSGIEIFIWILCFMPLSFAGQNMLFQMVKRCGEEGEKKAGSKVLGKFDQWFTKGLPGHRKNFHRKRGFCTLSSLSCWDF